MSQSAGKTDDPWAAFPLASERDEQSVRPAAARPQPATPVASKPGGGGGAKAGDWWDAYPLADEAVEDRPSYVSNLGRGMVERAGDLAGGLTRIGGAVLNALSVDDLAGWLERTAPLGQVRVGADGIEFVETPDDEIGAPFGRETSAALAGSDFGYEPRTTWEDVKERPISELIPYALETGLVSAPDMAAVLLNLPAYVAARTGEIGQERAENDKRAEATIGDFVAAAPAAVASAFLERLGARGMLGLDDAVRTIGDIPGAMARAGVKEAGTEAGQEALEYGGATIGTERGFDIAEAGERALAGAAAGGPFGATARAVSGTVEAAAGLSTPGAAPPPTDRGERQVTANELPPLSPADEASPIPSDLIQAGKAEMADVDAKGRANAILQRNGLPTVGGRVAVTIDGQSVEGEVVDAFTSENRELGVAEDGVKVRLDDGRMVDEFVSVLNASGGLRPAAAPQAAPAPSRVAPTTAQPKSPEGDGWVDLEDEKGNVVGRYNERTGAVQGLQRGQEGRQTPQGAEADPWARFELAASQQPQERAEPAYRGAGVDQRFQRPGEAPATQADIERVVSQVQALARNTRAALRAERVAERLGVDQTTATRALGLAAGRAGSGVQQTKAGAYRRTPRRQKPMDLYETLAAYGGLQQTDDVAQILDGNPFVPGFGKLIRRNGLSLNEARELLEDEGFIVGDDAKARDDRIVLALLDRQARGAKVYSTLDAGYAGERQIEQERAARGPSEAEVREEIAALAAEHRLDLSDVETATALELVAGGATVEDAIIEAVTQTELAQEATAADKTQERGDDAWDIPFPELDRRAAPVADQTDAGARGEAAGSVGDRSPEIAPGREPIGAGAGDAQGVGPTETVDTTLGTAEQTLIPGSERSARQAQAARDQQRGGRMRSEREQKPADEGLFATPDTTGDLFEGPSSADPVIKESIRRERESPPFDPVKDRAEAERAVRESVREYSQWTAADVFLDDGGAIKKRRASGTGLYWGDGSNAIFTTRDGRTWGAPTGAPRLPSRQTPLRPLTGQALERAIQHVADNLAETRAAIQKHQDRFDATAEEVAGAVDAAGLDARVVFPDDTSSRYVYVAMPDGGEFKIRIADHPQPVDWVTDPETGQSRQQTVGGFSRKEGRRHAPADISIDPETGVSVGDAIEAALERAGQPPRDSRRRDRAARTVEVASADVFGTAKSAGGKRLRAVRAVRAHIGKTVRNAETQRDIKVARSGVEHTTQGAGLDLLVAASRLPDVLRVARYSGRAADRRNRPNVAAVHTFEADVRVDGREMRANITVIEDNNGERFYDMALLKEARPTPREKDPKANLDRNPSWGADYDMRLSAAEIKATEERLRVRLSEYGLSDKIAARLTDRLPEGVQGRYRGAWRLIDIAIDAYDGAAWTLDHEVVHALRDIGVFRDLEWNALEKAALADRALMSKIRERYTSLKGDEDALIEEAVADMFADWRFARLENPPNAIRRAFERVVDFLRALAGAMDAAGVMRAMERGAVGRRAQRAQRGGNPGLKTEGALKGKANPTERYAVAVWHGTGADFDAFDLEHIGSGEGAQAFGWGVYFTETRKVAEYYRRITTDTVDVDRAVWMVEQILDDPEFYGADSAADIDAPLIEESLRSDGVNASATEQDGAIIVQIGSRRQAGGNGGTITVKNGQAKITEKHSGRLFRANLLPDDGDWLLWDAPLSEQSEKVKGAEWSEFLDADEFDAITERLGYAADWMALTGENIYQVLRQAAERDSLEPNGPGVLQALDMGEHAKAASLFLMNEGIPGIKYLDGMSRGRVDGRDSGSHNYVVFDAAHIEIEEKFSLPRGQRQPALDGVAHPMNFRARRSVLEALADDSLAFVDRVRKAASGDAVTESVDRMREALQDRFLPLLRVQQAVEKQMGRTLGEIENPYLAEELSSGRKGAKIESLTENHVRPLMEEMHRLGVSIAEMETYLYARHAPERNARVAEINPEFSPGEGSGMTDAEAADIMKAVEESGKLEAMKLLAERVDALTAFSVEERVKAGLLSEQEAAAWRAAYKHYVPLRGLAETDPDMEGEPDRPRKARGVTVTGRESQRAFGRRSKARDILAYTIMQAEEAVLRGETNRVARAFYELAKAAPDETFWTINKITRKPVWNKTTQQVEYRSTPVLDAKDRDYTVTVKIDGVEHRVTMNRDNPAAVRLAGAMRNLRADQFNLLIRTLSQINRYLSQVNTSLNPEFTITNAFRDIQTAAINLNQYDVNGLVSGTLRDYRKALKGAMRGSFGKTDGAWGRHYKEFIDNGGRVYFNQVEDVSKLRTKLESDYAAAKPGFTAKKAWVGTFKFIEQVNLGVENAVRLSAFKNAREAGMSPAQAASLAKNLTVNFNRRGRLGPVMNSGYLFYNASVQGSAVLFTAMKSKRVRKIMGGVVATGALIEIMNALASDEDDDGELYYDKLSDYTKSRNLIIMVPGSEGEYISIPLPYGYNAFFHLGRAMVEPFRGRPAGETLADLATTIVDSFNPIGGTESLMNFIAPTVVDPLVDLTRNRDYADRRIMPEQPAYGPEIPDAQRYWNSVSPVWRTVSEALTDITGGDEVRPGAIDVSPETLDHLFGVVTGAAGSFVQRQADLVGKLVDPTSEVEINDIAFARKLVGGKPGWYDRSAFYERTREIEQIASYVEGYKKRGDAAKAREVVEENRGLLRLQGAAGTARKALSKLRKQRDALRKAKEDGKITEAVFLRRFDQIKAREDAIVTRFNSLWNAAVTGRE